MVPDLLRAEGLRLVTLSEHYGIPADEAVADEEWLEFAGASGKAVLMKDTRIRYNRAEREAVKRHGVRCFCLTRQDLTGPEMAARFTANLEAITQSVRGPRPVHLRSPQGPHRTTRHRRRLNSPALRQRSGLRDSQ